MQEISIIHKNIGVEAEHPILFNYRRTPGDPKDNHYHLHDLLEIYVFVHGNVDFVIGDSYIPLCSGDVLFTFPNELHHPVVKSNALYERYYITLPLNTFEKYSACPESPLQCFLDARNTGNRRIRLRSEMRSEFMQLMHCISQCVTGQMREGYLIYAYFLQALHLLNDSPNIEDKTDPELSPLLQSVLKYVSENYMTVNTVQEIADYFHVNASYLSSLFCDAMHINLKRHLQYTKISGAKTLLAKGANVTEACFACGFNNCSYFISVFKAITGMTPNRYRRIYHPLT